MSSLTATPTAKATPSNTATCWYPDKSTEATNDRPCNSGNEGGFSACCGADNICLSNGYCILGGVFINRGSCTDQSWSDKACPQQCRDGVPNHGTTIYQCEDVDTNPLVACDSVSNCGTSNFSFPSYNYVIREYQVASLGLSSGFTITTDAADAATSTTTFPEVDTTSSLPVAGTTSCAAEQSLQAAFDREQNKVVAVGAGLGVPLGLLLILIPILFWLERKKGNRRVIEQGLNGGSRIDNIDLGVQKGTTLGSPIEVGDDRAYQELAADGTADGAAFELANGRNGSLYRK